MNGIHDMGGMHGFGPVQVEKDEPIFHQPWEARIFAMRGPFVGNVRITHERMPPALYLTTTYYEKWLWAKIENLLAYGAFTQEEFDERVAYYRSNPQAEPPRRDDPEAAARAVAAIIPPYSPREKTFVQPTFRIGESVRIRNYHPAGHTRLPRYVRGKSAVIVNFYGMQDFADDLPGEQESPQAVYNVRFEGQELWGESAEPNSAVYLDMWECYLI